jgi:hypothetical protein
MAELTISQLIKIILGIFVFAAVVFGIYLLVKNQVIDFFKGFNSSAGGIFLALKW